MQSNRILQGVKVFFSRNLGLKVISALMAMVLWLIVVNQQDPIKSDTIYNVPITILNEGYFEEHSQYAVVDANLKMNVTVSGNRSVIESMDSEDITATIDFLLVDPEEGKARISCSSNIRNVEITNQSIYYVRVNVENMIKKEFEVELLVEGEPAEGMFLMEGDPNRSMEPQSVTIEGPESVVADVTRAVVVLNAENAESDISGKGKAIQFLNDEGEELMLDDVESVKLSARLVSHLLVPLYRKIELSLSVPQITSVADDCYISDVSLLKDQILLYVPVEYNEPDLYELPVVSAKGQEAAFEKTVKVSEICQKLSRESQCTIWADDEEEEITIQINLKKKVIQKIPVEIGLTEIYGAYDSFTYHLNNPTIEVEVMGTPQELAELKKEEFKATIDVSEFTSAGSHQAPVTLTVPEGVVVLNGEMTLEVIIANK